VVKLAALAGILGSSSTPFVPELPEGVRCVPCVVIVRKRKNLQHLSVAYHKLEDFHPMCQVVSAVNNDFVPVPTKNTKEKAMISAPSIVLNVCHFSGLMANTTMAPQKDNKVMRTAASICLPSHEV